MGAMFIISFDCEGKWGIADHLQALDRVLLTNHNLNRAYVKIIDLLNRYKINATFAFVGAFTMSIDEYYTHREWFENASSTIQNWLQYFKRETQSGNFDGWFNPEPIMMVSQEGSHEIGGHGFSHIPLGESFISKADFIAEMDLFKKVPYFKDRERMTFIYPRNDVGYIDELRQAGFIGYRDALYYSGRQRIFFGESAM